jgi:TolB-like protein/lipoprotein NlpI
LRGDLDRIVLKLLAQEKSERYVNADELLQAVDGYLNRRQEFSKRLAAVVAGTALVACGLGGYVLWPQLQEAGKPTARTVAVLPFTNLDADPRNRAFNDGVAEDISTQLGKVAGLNVICNEATRRYKDSPKSLREIADELKATALVVGSVRRAGRRLRIVSRVIDPRTESQLWSESFDRVDEDIFAIQTAVATNVAQVLQATITPEVERRIAQPPTASLTAYDYYRKGLEYYSFYRKEDNERAIALFNKALEYDPQYALAWAGLGDAYAQKVEKFDYPVQWLDRAFEASRKAISLDPELAEGHKALGLVYLYKGQYRKALEAESTAIQLNPNYFAALNVFAYANGYQGKWDKAVEALRTAQRLNPTNPYGYSSLGEAYLALGMDAEAERQIRQAIELQPDVYNGYSQLSFLYLLQKNYRGALAQAQQCIRVAPEDVDCRAAYGNAELYAGNLTAALQQYEKIPTESRSIWYAAPASYLYEKTGRHSDSQHLMQMYLKYGKNKLQSGDENYDIPYQMAVIYCTIGDQRKALEHLEIAYKLGWRRYREAMIAPFFAPLRIERKFQQLLIVARKNVESMRGLAATRL